MVAQLHPAHNAAGHPAQHLCAEGGILHPAALAGNAVYPLLVVELPHQLNDQVAFLRKCPVRALQHVPAQLAARLLQRRNGTGSGQAAGGAALAHVPVAAHFLQLAHPGIPVVHAVAAQHVRLQRHKAVAVQPPHNVHDVLGKVRQLFLVHPRRVAQHKALLCRQLHVLVHGVVHLVNGGLGVLHHVDVPKPRRGIFLYEQRVKHKGVLSMVVKSPLRQLRVVLAGIQHHAVAVLAVVQHRLSAGLRLLVVPVHHHALIGGVNAVVVDVLPHVQPLAGVPLHLREAPDQLLVVLKAQAEQVRRLLNVLHPRCPVQHQQVHALDADVSQPAPQHRVPEDALHAGAGLELAPPCVAVHLLVVALLQHRRDHLGKGPRRLLVVRRSRQHVRLRVVVHGVRVLVGNAVEQPPAGRLRLSLHHLVLVVLPVPHPEPQLVFNDPLVQRRLAGLVPLQDLSRLGYLLRPDHRLRSRARWYPPVRIAL